MNYYPNTWSGAPKGAGPPEARGPMQPHRLHWLKAGPGAGRAEVKFSDYLISDDGIRPPPEKREAIKNYPKLTTVKGINRFWVQ